MAVTTTKTNKPINPRGEDKSPLAFNRAKLYSGKALDFDGVNDYVDLDGFTMTGTTATFVFNFNTDVLGIFRYLFDISNNRFIIGFGSASGVIQLYDGAFKNIFTPTIGEWYNLIISIDGTTANCYVNGVLETTLSITAIDLSSATQCALGANKDKGGSFWQGYVSGTRIFNTALTAAQVADLYNNPEKVVPTGVDNTALKLWLPMMEGAGTTAYDGSGNGNHGTISGATWTHGIGAPVAQTAVIDWNKGTNLLLQSNNFDTTWSGSASVTSGQSGYDGTNDAWLITKSLLFDSRRQVVTNSGVGTFSVYAKAGSYNYILLHIEDAAGDCLASFDLNPSTTGNRISGLSNSIDANIEDVGSGWYRCSVTFNRNVSDVRIYPSESGGYTGTSGNIYIQNAQLESASTAGPYVLTLSTAQSSEVLIPQSLTSGRDLFYNSFENVRKQYALNLDGQSWAEIHDNESLDFGTGEFTIEAWAKVKFVNAGSSYNVIMTLGGNASATGNANITMISGLTIAGIYNNLASGSSTLTEADWIHIVFSYDQTNATLYINGSQVDQDARTAADITNDLVKQIGRDTTGVRYYSDQIAQPRIYNRALTADEVEQNYNAGKNTYS